MKTIRISIAALALSACTTRTETATAPQASGELGRSVQAGQQTPVSHGKQNDASATALTTSFQYFDGSDKRTVWVSNDLVAEFAPSDAGKQALLQSDSAAQEVPQPQKGVRIWRVHASQDVDTFARNATSTALRVSPVLHDSATGGLPLRALPGGVVVTFPENWDRARIDAWLEPHKLKIDSEVVASANMYLVATPAGLDSLRIANELFATGELVSATPNFWQQAQTR